MLLHASPVAHHAAETSAAYAIAHFPRVIIKAAEVINAGQVVAFQITFSKPVIAAPLSDLSHYAILDLSPQNHPPATLASAAYNSAQNTLTLTLTTPLPPGPFTLTAPGDLLRPSTSFITDAQGAFPPHSRQ